MARLALLTSNFASRDMFFRAGGIRFIADILPYLSRHHDVEFYVAGAEDDKFEYRGATVHIVRSRKIPFVDKRFLPDLKLDADLVIFLDYTAALSPNSGPINLVVMHHLAQSFRDENPALYRRYFGRIGQRYVQVERILLGRVRKKAPVALVVSDITVPYLTDLGFEVHVVGNGIDVDHYRPREKEDYAVAIGRLVNYKRFEWAIDVSRRTGVPLKIIGTGPLESYLRRIAHHGVEFLGYVDEDEKTEILARAKYLFSFSAFEGFDLPVIEALASGTVPVVSRIRAHEFIASGSDAVVMVSSIGDAVRAVLEMEQSPTLYNWRSAEGRRLAEERWNAKTIAANYIRIIDRYL